MALEFHSYHQKKYNKISFSKYAVDKYVGKRLKILW